MKGIVNSETQKIIALKKNETFTYVSIKNQVQERKAPLLEERYGEDYKTGGYKFKISKRLLEKREL
ncbi:hypothetical protein [Psychroserpens luteus]|uniref:KTSC domain-containing protein n=1 Tax=Psychroserpens luteus TaxID=1434066 RepID=A0ABW5ZX74_9FLAO|nr:hypothetical protein [Psychroserpens luteus]